MLRLRDTSYNVGETCLFRPQSLRIGTGEFVAICGPNGAGKTTLLRLLSGELSPSTGVVTQDGFGLNTLSPAVLARKRAVLPQISRVLFEFTVIEVVRLAFSTINLPVAAQDRLVTDMLSRVGLDGFASRYYHQLSGGEQQRVQFARVLCQFSASLEAAGSHYLMLDEPISSLDMKHQIELLKCARSVVSRKTGVIAVLHDLNLASIFADRILMLKKGLCVSDGPPATAITDATMSDVFDIPLQVNSAPGGGATFVLPHAVTDS